MIILVDSFTCMDYLTYLISQLAWTLQVGDIIIVVDDREVSD